MVECSFCHNPVPPRALRCPYCNWDLSQAVDDEGYSRPPTLTEPSPGLRGSLDGARRPAGESRPPSGPPRTLKEPGSATQNRASGPPPGATSKVSSARTLKEPSGPAPVDHGEGDDRGGGSESSTIPFRPIHRPPMLLLCIYDDGGKTGEWIRIRGSKFSIGRSQGDLIVSHDPGMSGQHADLERRFDGAYSWYLKDLGSKNGTFVRCANARLRPNQDLMIGHKRYRFTLPQSAEESQASDGDNNSERIVTRAAPRVDFGDMLPALRHLDSTEGDRHFLLPDSEQWIGSDPTQVPLVIRRDPSVCPRHAKIYKEPNGRWFIEDNKSVNGTWMRISDDLALERNCEFQLGEQRFSVRIP